MFEPRSVYGNTFIGVDGEGVGDEYVLLDSGIADYPRLYTGKRLTNLECLDWLWGLGKHAGYATFCLFGAGYDFNNWLYGIPFEDVKRYANGDAVRIGDYLVIWQSHFKWELRHIADEDVTQPEYSANRYTYSRISTRHDGERENYRGLVFWDVLPWWQCSFLKALDMTLKDRIIDRELIVAGKDARGSFTHDNIEWVSTYNKAECANIGLMMVELDKWFQSADVRPRYYNGPGSAAKAMLATYAPYLHAGRRIDRKQSSVSNRVKEYHFPGADSNHAMLQRGLSAFAGALNRQLQIGYHPGHAWQYDIVSAYPFVTRNLPCLSHGEWERTREFDGECFGIWKVRYRATRAMSCYPFFWRDKSGAIEYPHTFDERWAHTAEVAGALAVDPAGLTILDGWRWRPDVCDNPFPFWWITNAFRRRQIAKAEGREGEANGLKLPLNSLYGSIAQARGGTLGQPPWSQQLLWAGAITAMTRVRLYLAYCLNPDAIVHLATDGIISLQPLPLKLGDGLGDWEVRELRDLTVVQYGVYAGEELQPDGTWKRKHRERGFQLTDALVDPFIARIHDMWEHHNPWVSMQVTQHAFITAGLVAMSEKRYDEWCTWQDIEKEIELDRATQFQEGHVKDHPFPGMWPIWEASMSRMRSLPASKLYEPKWGKGADFPRELRQDEWQQALEVSA